MDPAERSKLTEAEYLAMDEAAEVRHDFVGGEAWAMAGGSPRHARLTMGLGLALGVLRASPCQAFSPDLRVHVGATGNYFYPDLTVICGPVETFAGDRNSATNPTLIAEVLSASTEAYDRGTKWRSYQTIESLSDFLLIAQDEPRVSHYQRVDADRWMLTEYQGLEAAVALPNLGCTLALAEIYAGYLDVPGDAR